MLRPTQISFIPQMEPFKPCSNTSAMAANNCQSDVSEICISIKFRREVLVVECDKTCAAFKGLTPLATRATTCSACYGKLMRSYRLLYVLLALILSGCSIPYQTPEARQQIEHDLQIAPGSVRALSQTNWCYLPYGSENGGDGQCRATQGLGVLVDDGLILSTYSGGRYQRFITLRTRDVLCVKTFRSREAAAAFFAFTRAGAAQIIPLTAEGQFNTPVKIQFLDYLLGENQPGDLTTDKTYVRDTGKNAYSVGIIPGTKIPYVSAVAATEVFNPCPEK